MALPTHKEIPSFSKWYMGSGPTTVLNTYNANLDDIENELQVIENSLEDSNDTLHGSGVIYGLTVSPGSGLYISVSEGKALIGYEISIDTQNIAVLPNANPGYVFMCQDGTFVVNTSGEEPEKASFLLCRYTSDDSSVTEIYEDDIEAAPRIVPIVLRVAHGVFEEAAPGESGYSDFYVDHSSQVSFVIPGKIKLTVTDGFTVSHLYGGFIDENSDTPDSPPLEDTPTGFWIRLAIKEGEEYPETAVIEYWRYGLTYAEE